MKAVLVLGTIAAVLLCGCGRQSPPAEESAAPSRTSAWTCMMGTEGGFTGGGNGYEIHSTGQVLAWSRSTASSERETRPLGSVDSENLAPLTAAVERSRSQALSAKDRSNMTTFFRWTAEQEGLDTFWTWPADRMGGRDPKVPQSIRDCYEAALDIVRQVEEQP